MTADDWPDARILADIECDPDVRPPYAADNESAAMEFWCNGSWNGHALTAHHESRVLVMGYDSAGHFVVGFGQQLGRTIRILGARHGTGAERAAYAAIAPKPT